MALFAAPTPTRSITVPSLILMLIAETAFILFCLIPSPPPVKCSCPPITTTTTITTTTCYADSAYNNTSSEDIDWLKSLQARNSLTGENSDEWHELRKGINPRPRPQQLEDLKNYKGIAHYEGAEAAKHTRLPCPLELLVEEHHSYYGEPWAGGRDIFDFLHSKNLKPSHMVFEVGCGSLRAGHHVIRYLEPEHYHCLERDEGSLTAGLKYEIPANGLENKKPLILKGEDMDFSRFGDNVIYDIIYASAVFLHVPDKLVWVALERLAVKLRPDTGRLFITHNMKFCTRLRAQGECTRRLSKIGLEFVGNQTHDSKLFNHFETWFEFRRIRTFALS